ncbi:hypothetical protein [Agromyces sp. SYSU T0242]|uniref:hypothetical protein n=1 Tax=Agromyces litoreus TaxID=3158561 RepID=UPI003395BA00
MSDRHEGDRHAGLDGAAGVGAGADGTRPAPARIRVTAPRAGSADRSAGARRGTVLPGPPGAGVEPEGDVRDTYVRSLIRSQLRLALTCAAGCALATVAFVLAITLTPVLDESYVAGVPASWLLLGFGIYPLAITVAVLFVRAAARNEARYRSLAEES